MKFALFGLWVQKTVLGVPNWIAKLSKCNNLTKNRVWLQLVCLWLSLLNCLVLIFDNPTYLFNRWLKNHDTQTEFVVLLWECSKYLQKSSQFILVIRIIYSISWCLQLIIWLDASYTDKNKKMSDKAVKKCFHVILIMIKIKSPSRFLSLNKIKKDIDFHYSTF